MLAVLKRTKIKFLFLIAFFALSPHPLLANDGVPVDNVAPMTLEETLDQATESANLGWLLVSTALVLFMTAPGLALFYSGLVRRKNVLGVMMQCLFLMGLMSVVWALWGYSLSFGEGSRFVGNFESLMLNGLTMKDGKLPGEGIPDLAFMIFQCMFFVITPVLICGAFAERMKFSAMVVFMIAWGTFVYCPLCHMVWGEGWLFFGGQDALLGGALDFAGGTVVHISAGISALVCAIIIGPRMGFGKHDMRPHNLTYTAMGATMLWVGWFGFNAGSAIAVNDLAVNAFVVTHLAASTGAIAWATTEWLLSGKPSVLGTASGAISGLVCITPAAGFVHPMPALFIGVSAGVACYFACGKLKKTFGYDDSLDVFGIHGIGGALGALLTGVFATTDVNPAGANGVFYGGSIQLLLAQMAAVGVAALISIIGSFILLKVIELIIGLRVDSETEQQGLDLGAHGEEGYIFN